MPVTYQLTGQNFSWWTAQARLSWDPFGVCRFWVVPPAGLAILLALMAVGHEMEDCWLTAAEGSCSLPRRMGPGCIPCFPAGTILRMSVVALGQSTGTISYSRREARFGPWRARAVGFIHKPNPSN